MLHFTTLMGVVFKPHRLLGDGFHPGQAGRQDPTEVHSIARRSIEPHARIPLLKSVQITGKKVPDKDGAIGYVLAVCMPLRIGSVKPQLWYIKPPYKYTREGSYHIFIFPTRRVHALKIRQINSTILKVLDAALSY